MGHLDKLYEKYADRGLVVISVTDEPRSKVDAWIESTGQTSPILIEESSSMRDFGFNAFPSAALIGPDGEVLYAGSPGGINEQLIEQHLGSVRLMPELPDSLSDVAKAYGKNSYDDAIKKLERHLAGERLEDADRAVAQEFLDGVLADGKSGIATAKKLADGGDPYASWKRLEKLVDAYGKHDIGVEAAKAQDALENDDAAKDELKAGEKWAKLTSKLSDLSKKKAIKALESFVKKYGETKAGQTAQKRLVALQKQR